MYVRSKAYDHIIATKKIELAHIHIKSAATEQFINMMVMRYCSHPLHITVIGVSNFIEQNQIHEKVYLLSAHLL